MANLLAAAMQGDVQILTAIITIGQANESLAYTETPARAFLFSFHYLNVPESIIRVSLRCTFAVSLCARWWLGGVSFAFLQ